MNTLEILTLLQILFQSTSLRCPTLPHKHHHSSQSFRRQTSAAGGGGGGVGRSGDGMSAHKNWHLVNDAQCGSSLADRIIGGVNATLGEYPWLARIGYVNPESPGAVPVYRCGGTLVNRDYVLTAAHCVTNLPGTLTIGSIRLGDYNINTDPDCTEDLCADHVKDFTPAQVLVHKHYGSPPNRNDIALIKLNQSVEYTKWIVPICLPFGDLMKKNLTDVVAEVAGWGFYDMSIPTGSVVLQTVKLPIITTYRCGRAFRQMSLNESQQLCVGGEVGKDSCNGDSGGPLMRVEAVDGPPRYYLLGIVSFGARFCGLTTAPAVYTRITAYIHWILNNIRDV